MKLIALTLRTLSNRNSCGSSAGAPLSDCVANAPWCEGTRRWRSGQQTHHQFSPF
jgi:hypothetical protein